MDYTDPYETYKAQHGGSGAGYQAQQQIAPPAAMQPSGWNSGGTPQAAPAPAAAPSGGGDWYSQFSANSDWKDPVYGEAQWNAWKNEQNAKGGAQAGCPPNLPFTGRNGQCAAKPDDCPDGMRVVGSDTNGTARCVNESDINANGGVGPVGGGGGGGGAGGAGGVPQFNAPRFTPPSYAEAMNDPGYQFALKQGQTGLEHSQAAQGMLRTGGSLADLLKYNQDMATQQYGNVYNRAANTYGLNYQAAKDEFAPQYGGWQTMYQGDLSKWNTNANINANKYMQQQANIYGLINQPMPTAPSWA